MRTANNRIKAGFTLAETLITMAIIGIVAAMTMPALINKFQVRTTVSKLKKFYSVLSQSYLYAVQEYGEVSQWGITGRDAINTDDEQETYYAENAILIRDRLFKNAKTLKVCDNAKNRKACGMSDVIYWMDGSYTAGGTTMFATLRLADGSAVSIIANPLNNSRGSGALSETYALIVFDTNGLTAPNTYGKDVFVFILTKQNIIPEGTVNETTYIFDKDCPSKGRGCTAWVLYNENMDYLKCSDLSWDGRHTCN